MSAESSDTTHASGLRKLALTAALLGLGLFCVYVANERTRHFDPLDAVPDGAFIVATADVERLRRSPLYDALFGAGTGRAFGLGGVEAACGFDPISRVETLAFVVPEEGDQGEFGIAATVLVKPDEIKACAAALSPAKDASSSSSADNLKKQGDFFIIEGRGPSSPRLAYRPENDARGLLLVGKGTMVDAMVAAQEGTRARFLRAPGSAAHIRLRTTLAAAPTPAIIITAIIPEATRARIKNEMAPELERSPDARDIMSGVLGVDTAGAALVAGEGGGNAELRVELTCTGHEEDCASVKLLLEKKRLEMQKNFGIRLLAGALLDSLTVEQAGAHVTAHTAAPAADVARMIDRALDFRKRGRDQRDPRDQQDPLEPRDRDFDRRPHLPRPPGQMPAQMRAPDEMIRAAPDAGKK